MKTSQNVLKMSTVSHDTSREICDATDWWLQQQSNGRAFSMQLTVSVSILQGPVKIKCLRLRRLRWNSNCRCPKWTQE